MDRNEMTKAIEKAIQESETALDISGKEDTSSRFEVVGTKGSTFNYDFIPISLPKTPHSIPGLIGQIKTLRILNLSNNRIMVLPYETRNLDNLTSIDLRKCLKT